MTKLLVVNAQNSVSSEKDIYNAGMYMCYGVAAIIFGIVAGKISDRKGHLWLIIPYIILEISGLVGILLLAKFSATGPLGLWFIIGFIKGTSDNFLNTLVTVLILSVYQKDSNLMFAFYRFTYAVSYVIISLLIGYISYEWILLICGIFIILFIVTYAFFCKFNKTVDSLDKEFTNSAVTISNIV
jgi:MFS family permease